MLSVSIEVLLGRWQLVTLYSVQRPLCVIFSCLYSIAVALDQFWIRLLILIVFLAQVNPLYLFNCRIFFYTVLGAVVINCGQLRLVMFFSHVVSHVITLLFIHFFDLIQILIFIIIN